MQRFAEHVLNSRVKNLREEMVVFRISTCFQGCSGILRPSVPHILGNEISCSRSAGKSSRSRSPTTDLGIWAG